MHVKTDVFCSASLVLPDKGGRQINTAGWSDQAEYGIRLYTPTGSPGVPSTSDWEEDVNVLKTQVLVMILETPVHSNRSSTPSASSLVCECGSFSQR
jgi:hypothetical protein